MHSAVAVDLGATSGRFAHGRLVDGRIEFEVIEQIPHNGLGRDGRWEWDLETLLGLCRRAVAFAEAKGALSVGIDSWGVDHGFLDAEGGLIGAPVCYRDQSHRVAFEELAPRRAELYSLTGTQHQPFNTICQLVARREEDPSLPGRARFLILPDLLGYLLGGGENHEQTQASTTQLMGLDGKWSERAFEIAGWPVPEMEPAAPGTLGGIVGRGIRLAHVGSHDTASAVAGFGALADDQIFVNVGTWSLAGAVIPKPIASAAAEKANLTNEWTVDGRVRLLKNIPGFFVVNRLHDELCVKEPVPVWLKNASWDGDERLDLLDDRFFNPESMVQACGQGLRRQPKDDKEWAGLALASLTHLVASQPAELGGVTGRTYRSFRVGGGGSQSEAFCQSLADESGLPVHAGPVEATVLGNLAAQFLASGALKGWTEAYAAIGRSTSFRTYEARV